MELTVFKGASRFFFICDISKFKFYFSVILWLKFDQAPLVNAFCCVFKKEFFKHFQKKFYFSIFLSLKKLQNSVFSSFWSLQFCLLQDVKFLSFFRYFLVQISFFINFVEEVCPHPPHEHFILQF